MIEIHPFALVLTYAIGVCSGVLLLALWCILVAASDEPLLPLRSDVDRQLAEPGPDGPGGYRPPRPMPPESRP